MPTYEVIVEPGGSVRHLETPGSDVVLAHLGKPQTAWRNSHIECTETLRPETVRYLSQRLAIHRTLALVGYSYDAPWSMLKTAYPHKWWADMQPVGGGVLGPFDTREMAYAAEIAWLQEHNLPELVDHGTPA